MAVDLGFIADVDFEAVERQMRKSSSRPRPNPADLLATKRHIVRKQLARQFEALNLYEPLPLSDKVHQCNALWRLLEGGNRGGKSLTALVEMARAMCGCDPYNKYPKQNGRALLVGLKLEIEIARMYRTLFHPGAFKIVPDEHTKLWRAVRYDHDNPLQLQAYDLAYLEKWRDAPPLIPQRMIRGKIAWEDKAKDVPRLVPFKTGWKSIWLSSMGKPEQGEHYNAVLFDEEMANREFYVEALRGLTRLAHEPVTQRPKGMWAATAQLANPELAELRDKAIADPDSDFVQRYEFKIDDNPYFLPSAKAEFYEGMSEADRQTRYYGVPALFMRRVYGHYNPMGNSADGTGHGCEPFEIDPAKTTRYVIIDPSITRCAILFVCVDEDEQFMTVYDGLAITKASPALCAAAVLERQRCHHFELGILDYRMGRTSLSSREPTTVAREYWLALEEAGVKFRQRGSLQGFFPGNDNMDTRTASMLKMMEVRGLGPWSGTCKLRVMRGRVPELDKEISRAVTDPKHPSKRLKQEQVDCDLLDTLEYACVFSPGYKLPESIEPDDTSKVYQAFLEKEQKSWQQPVYA